MQITYVLELLNPTRLKRHILESNIYQVYLNRTEISKQLKLDKTNLSSKDFDENLPSAVVNQNIREVNALYKLFKKSKSHKDNLNFKFNQPICFNNQNYKINNHFVSFPLYTVKSKRYWFPVVQNETFHKLSSSLDNGAKLGKSSLFRKNNKYYLAVTISIQIKQAITCNTMGIDIGLNQLAVASVEDINGLEINRVFYSGKEAGFVRKKYRSIRRSLGKAKQPKKIKDINNKESRYMTNLNHKISRQLVNLAVQERVSTIAMENLKNIRETAYSSKKSDKNLNSWAFFELQMFIDYKAKLSGIEVSYINPKYTSQTCSICGVIKKTNRDRNLYTCQCGHKIHADLNAARNICSKKKAVKQQSA